jgi:hypothetical protein
VLDQGSVAESGTHSILLDQDGIYKSLYQNKFNDSGDIDKSSRGIVRQEHLPTFTEEPVEQGYLIDEGLVPLMIDEFEAEFDKFTTELYRK